MAARTPFAFVICVWALLLAQLAIAQVNPVPLPKNDPNYVKIDIELLKKVKAGDDGLKKRYVAYYINVRSCCSLAAASKRLECLRKHMPSLTHPPTFIPPSPTLSTFPRPRRTLGVHPTRTARGTS